VNPEYDADIVILALERVEETLAAIRSALAQTGITRRVIVVDQGSAPDTIARLEHEIGGRADATLVRLGRNHGVGGGRNIGAGLGHGRIIAALDNDAEFATPDTLARAVAALDTEADLAAVGMRIIEYDTGRDDLLSWGYPTSLLARAGERFATVTFVGAGHAIHRAAWAQAGGYDESLRFTWEEYDFCLRAIELGWRIAYRGDLVVRHKVSAERRFQWSGERWFHFVRNRIVIERKWAASWPSLAPRIGGYLVRGARAGLLRQTIRAVVAAAHIEPANPRRLSPQARAYLRANDGAHRGTLPERIRREVLAALPGRSTSRAIRSRSSSAKTGGLSTR